ncbi:Diguanylate cyclase DgcM [Anaerolineae bacterium]|nr:Diguanylate cyclase DgcM [Anaerolineae bacterium]
MQAYDKMTKAELIKVIKRLETKLRNRTTASQTESMILEHDRLVHDLQVHQVELETQNEELRRTHQLLEQSRDRYANLYDLAPIGYATLDGKGMIVEINLTGAAMLGKERARLIGMPFSLAVVKRDIQTFHNHLRRCKKSQEPVTTDLQLKTRQHDVIHAQLYSVMTPAATNQTPVYLTAIVDITDRKQAEEKLEHLSTHDSLTNLYNHAFFQTALARFERDRQFPMSIVMTDVDGLKQVNDKLGHDCGDELLCHVAQVLTASVRAEDIVARIGGDEFAILLPKTDAPAADKALTRVRDYLAIYNTAHPESSFTLSLGVATAGPGESLTKTLKQADVNMYREKQSRASETSRKESHDVLQND